MIKGGDNWAQNQLQIEIWLAAGKREGRLLKKA
jgi:hypothetical protein